MIWCLALAVVIAVIGVLGVLPSSDLNLTATFWSNDYLFLIMSILLVGCAFLYQKFWQIVQTTNQLGRILSFSFGVLVGVLILGFFVFRAMIVFMQFEQDVPQNSHTIQAVVNVDEISDSVYDNLLVTDYRQKATISNIKLVDNAHKYADNAKTITNPFGIVTSDVQQVKLPTTMTVLLSASAKSKQELSALQKLTPNTSVQMTLLISAVDKNQAAGGFDGYQWLRTRHIHANAKILSIDTPVSQQHDSDVVVFLQTLRQKLREHFYQNWHTLTDEERQAKAVSLSLLTGDRALITRETKQLYQFAGISHLLAISGSHVVFLALILAWLTTFITDKLKPTIYQYLSKTTLRPWVMLGAALLYALFTGFDVPAVRTVYMLLALVIVRQLALPISNLSVLAIVALLMIWLDPFVVWQAGFYLSFVAVLLLMRYDTQTLPTKNESTISQKIIALIKLQIWLFVAMLPISVWIFGKVSLWGLLVNIFAIGLFGMVIVPLNLLAGVIFAIVPFLADLLWRISSGILWSLHHLLAWLESISGDIWLYNTTGFLGVALCMMALVPFILPIINKRFALVPMMVFAFLLTANNEHPLLVDALPINDNQLSQVLLRQADADPHSVNAQANWLILSDFGSRMTADRFASQLIDVLKQQGVNHLTGVVVQTPSAMLSQALQQVHQRIPIYHYWQAGKTTSILPSLPCVADRTWQGNGLSVKAITGWTQISDSNVWDCAVVVDSIYAPRIQGVINDNDDSQSFIGNTQTDKSYRMMVGTIHQQKTWELYALMCHTPTKIDVWLTHTKSPLYSPIISQFSPETILFTDKDSAQNRQKAHQLLSALIF